MKRDLIYELTCTDMTNAGGVKEAAMSAEEVKRAPDDWLSQPEYAGLKVLDPDGWDRKNFAESWAEAITKEEFDRRVAESTCIFPGGFFARGG